MSKTAKQVPFMRAAAVFAELRDAGRRIVQCHGTFDLIHPGHIIHFEEAKALGDVLVVTVTAEANVNKGPGRPFFNDQLRAKWLSALHDVDYVVAVPYGAAVEAIECVRPHVYCKGKEYAQADFDVTGKIKDDIEAVRRVGGEVRYVGSVVFSSSKLLNNHFGTRDPEVTDFCRQVARICPPEDFRRVVEDFAGLRVLIVGDIIFDRYTTVQVQGLTSKNRILSGRYVGEDFQAGGALAAFRHVREFTPHVRLASLVGVEPWVEGRLAPFIAPAEQLIVRSPKFTTVVKQRYVEPREEGKELAKLFSVNFIDARHPGEDLQRAVLEPIAAAIDQSDLVIALDFGHGLLGDLVREYVQEKARFLAVNCQTNSNNHGFNILNSRYRRADAFSLDETEITLAAGRQHIDFRAATADLRRSLGARYGWLTRGSVETIGCSGDGVCCVCPPFERRVVDTLGAGDAFFSVAALAAARGLPLEASTFMGQLAGAQAVTVVGNAEPIRKARFLKGAASMLAF